MVELKALGLVISAALFSSGCGSQQAGQFSGSSIQIAQYSIMNHLAAQCDTPTIITLHPQGGKFPFPPCANFAFQWGYRGLRPDQAVQVTLEDGTNNFDKLPHPRSGKYIFYFSICCESANFVLLYKPKHPEMASLSAPKTREWNQSNQYELVEQSEGRGVYGNLIAPQCKNGLCTSKFDDHAWFEGLDNSDSYIHAAVLLENPRRCPNCGRWGDR
jgi:hypothetical protein